MTRRDRFRSRNHTMANATDTAARLINFGSCF